MRKYIYKKEKDNYVVTRKQKINKLIRLHKMIWVITDLTPGWVITFILYIYKQYEVFDIYLYLCY